MYYNLFVFTTLFFSSAFKLVLSLFITVLPLTICSSDVCFCKAQWLRLSIQFILNRSSSPKMGIWHFVWYKFCFVLLLLFIVMDWGTPTLTLVTFSHCHSKDPAPLWKRYLQFIRDVWFVNELVHVSYSEKWFVQISHCFREIELLSTPDRPSPFIILKWHLLSSWDRKEDFPLSVYWSLVQMNQGVQGSVLSLLLSSPSLVVQLSCFPPGSSMTRSTANQQLSSNKES